MIPKIVHYIWFGGNELGDKEQACLNSWKKNLPDYHIMRWDESNFDVSQNLYCQQAYDAKKWAFVSDYARLWALVNYGGLYFDTDLEVLKPLDDFLCHKAFSGFEDPQGIPTAIMGCEKGFPLFQSLLNEYTNRQFIMPDGSYDETTNVQAITEFCLSKGLVLNNTYQEIEGFALYPNDYFCPKSYETGEIKLTSNSVTIHHFSGSWIDPVDKAVFRRKKLLQKRFPFLGENIAGVLGRILVAKDRKSMQILFDAVKAKGK